MRHLRLAVALVFCLSGLPSFAHDMWIEPSSLAPAAGELLTVALKVGHPGRGIEVVPRNPERIERFAAISGGLESPILGQDGRHPAGLLRASEPGLLTLVYRGNAVYSELPAERFEAYLAEEGLTAISQQRQATGASTQPGRELYSRSLKALVAVGGASETGDSSQGLILELVAETHSFRPGPGAKLPLTLLYRGESLAGVLVEAFALDASAPEVRAVSDAKGRLELELSSPGPWVITATHMVALPAGSQADWESFWTALTLRLPAP